MTGDLGWQDWLDDYLTELFHSKERRYLCEPCRQWNHWHGSSGCSDPHCYCEYPGTWPEEN